MTYDDWVILYDPKLNEGTYVEIDNTPAGVLLKEDILLSSDIIVKNIQIQSDVVYASLFAKGHNITLVLSRDTLHLLGWIAMDMQGGRTQIQLENHEWNLPIPPDTWVYKELSKREKCRLSI